jgi:hypothetical protein
VVRYVAASLLAVVLVTGCRGQREGSVVIEGDSITWQLEVHGRQALSEDVHWNLGPGWTISRCNIPAPCTAPEVDIKHQLDAGEAETTIVLLGVNDADPIWNGGWNETDEARWLVAIERAPCVVAVLPWLGEGASIEHRTEVDEARDWLQANVEHVVDWKPYAQQPNVLDPDGIHLAYEGQTLSSILESVGGDVEAAGRLDVSLTTEAETARLALIEETLTLC